MWLRIEIKLEEGKINILDFGALVTSLILLGKQLKIKGENGGKSRLLVEAPNQGVFWRK